MKKHLQIGTCMGGYYQTACGYAPGVSIFLTHILDQVTCNACKKTRAYQEQRATLEKTQAPQKPTETASTAQTNKWIELEWMEYPNSRFASVRILRVDPRIRCLIPAKANKIVIKDKSARMSLTLLAQIQMIAPARRWINSNSLTINEGAPTGLFEQIPCVISKTFHDRVKAVVNTANDFLEKEWAKRKAGTPAVQKMEHRIEVL